jgi:8-oxo-dGTP pyrophosphatase MutT (NUDIX family)
VTKEPASPARTRWTIHGERAVDENPHIRLSVASVELPDGKHFEQYVFRLRRSVMTVVLDGPGERILLIWRHRFIVDRWDWEVPGGYVDPGEDSAAAAAREVEEETGWRPRTVEFLLTFQPALGSADAPQDLYVAHGADLVGEPEINEAEAVRWVPVGEAQDMIRRGEILGAATVIGVMHAAAERAGSSRPGTG